MHLPIQDSGPPPTMPSRKGPAETLLAVRSSVALPTHRRVNQNASTSGGGGRGSTAASKRGSYWEATQLFEGACHGDPYRSTRSEETAQQARGQEAAAKSPRRGAPRRRRRFHRCSIPAQMAGWTSQDDQDDDARAGDGPLQGQRPARARRHQRGHREHGQTAPPAVRGREQSRAMGRKAARAAAEGRVRRR